MISLLLVLCLTSSSFGLPDGFVYTGHLNVSYPILVSLRYGTNHNFVGAVVRGYENVPSQGAVVTFDAGEALAKAQEEFVKNGFQIVIYDAYRPSKAVDHFMEWAESEDSNVNTKRMFYPNVNKSDLFDLGYIASRSGHSRGSTIDLTLIRLDSDLTNIQVVERTLNNSYTIHHMEDGTVDMGSSFDIFDEVSHYDNPHIFHEHRRNREYLKTVMESMGFVPYDQEWWHFRLRSEPFPSTYFDFDMYDEQGSGGILWRPNILTLCISVIFTTIKWLQYTGTYTF